MSLLEHLIGKPLHLCTHEELEEVVMRGRLAREAETTEARAAKRASSGTKKKTGIAAVDLDGFDDDIDLDDFD